jgi:hypothetical protein
VRAFRYVGGALLLAGCSAPSGASQDRGRAPSYRLEPFLWLPTLTGEVPDGSGSPGPPIDVGLIGVEDLEYAMMLDLEVDHWNPRWALLIDSIYVRFDDDEGALHTGFDLRMFEMAAARPICAGSPVELLAGLRYWDLGADASVAPTAGLGRDESWLDPVIGVRGVQELSDAWSLNGRGDIGGFGLKADWSLQLILDAEYRFSSGLRLLVGYRHLFVDFDDLDLEVTVSGPLVGLSWKI